jgi:hypothetical protein
MTDEEVKEIIFEYDDVWEYTFKPSNNLFIRKIIFVAEDSKEDQTMFMLHYFNDQKMLCLLASEDLDTAKEACIKFFMSQKLDAE